MCKHLCPLLVSIALFAPTLILAAPPAFAGMGADGPRHAVMARVPFNDEAAFLGLNYSFVMFPDLGLALTVGGDSRLISVTTRERIRPHFLIQREEDLRTLIFLGVEEVYMFGRVTGVYGGAGMGYCWGTYAGTQINPPGGWTPTVEAGLQFRWKGTGAWGQLRAGYQYADLHTHPGNRAVAAIGAAF